MSLWHGQAFGGLPHGVQVGNCGTMPMPTMFPCFHGSSSLLCWCDGLSIPRSPLSPIIIFIAVIRKVQHTFCSSFILSFSLSEYLATSPFTYSRVIETTATCGGRLAYVFLCQSIKQLALLALLEDNRGAGIQDFDIFAGSSSIFIQFHS